MPHAAAAGGGTERCVVDGDDGLEIKRLVLTEKQVFEVVYLHVFKDGFHRSQISPNVDVINPKSALSGFT
jgi:hypothetical protein